MNKLISKMRRVASGAEFYSSVEKHRQEIEWLRTHQSEIENYLLDWDESLTRQSNGLSIRFFEDLEITQVSSKPLEASNPFHFKLPYREYDPFATELINSDAVNYFSAIRAQAREAREFGGAEEWLVFCGTIDSVIRYRCVGRISALRQQFPDELTATILRDSGVDITPLKLPGLILKV